jgi:hypothetical protein
MDILPVAAGSCPVIGPSSATVRGQFLILCAFALLPKSYHTMPGQLYPAAEYTYT